jgi:hypothetical protein
MCFWSVNLECLGASQGNFFRQVIGKGEQVGKLHPESETSSIPPPQGETFYEARFSSQVPATPK